MFLESRGIAGFILDEYFVRICWQYSNAIGGVRLVVEEEDADEAVALYGEYRASLLDGPYPLSPFRAWQLAAALTLVTGLPMLVFGRRGEVSGRVV
jgi:hypothetical protein